MLGSCIDLKVEKPADSNTREGSFYKCLCSITFRTKFNQIKFFFFFLESFKKKSVPTAHTTFRLAPLPVIFFHVECENICLEFKKCMAQIMEQDIRDLMEFFVYH